MTKNKMGKLCSAAYMPPLHHTVPGELFSINKSDVVAWLLKQPDVKQYVFDKAKEFLTYDSQTGRWKGIDYDN